MHWTNLSIPDNSTWVTSAINVSGSPNQLESVDVYVNISHTYRGDLCTLALESPSGTISYLAEPRSDPGSDYDYWRFGTVHNWGEEGDGIWTLWLLDSYSGDQGSLEDWGMELHGHFDNSTEGWTTSPFTLTYDGVEWEEGNPEIEHGNHTMELTIEDLEAGTNYSVEWFSDVCQNMTGCDSDSGLFEFNATAEDAVAWSKTFHIETDNYTCNVSIIVFLYADDGWNVDEIGNDHFYFNGPCEETAQPPCLGDACGGDDAGNNLTTYMDLTDDFSWTGEETISIFGDEYAATSYNTTSADNSDGYIIDLPLGYGFTAEVTWNHSGASFWENYAFLLALGPGDGCMVSYSACDWGRNYYSTTGNLLIGTDGEMEGGDYGVWDTTDPSVPPIDLVGDPAVIWVWCYYCFQENVSMDYTLNITVWPGDGGTKGDETTPQYNILVDMPDEPASWSYQSDTFEISSGESADLVVTYCDSWCTPESSIEVTMPNGTKDTFIPADFFTGVLATYSSPGNYTVEKIDGYGDGGLGLFVGSVIGNFSSVLGCYICDGVDDVSSGILDNWDWMDFHSISIPAGNHAEITLDWEADADLDMVLYDGFLAQNDPSSDLGGIGVVSSGIDTNWTQYGNPESISLGASTEDRTYFLEVIYSNGSAGAGVRGEANAPRARAAID